MQLTLGEKELTAPEAATTQSRTAVDRGLGPGSLPTMPPMASNRCKLSPTCCANTAMHSSTARLKPSWPRSVTVGPGSIGDKSCRCASPVLCIFSVYGVESGHKHVTMGPGSIKDKSCRCALHLLCICSVYGVESGHKHVTRQMKSTRNIDSSGVMKCSMSMSVHEPMHAAALLVLCEL